MNLNDQIFFAFYNLAHQSLFFDKVIVFFANIFPYLVILLAIIFLLFHHEVFFAEEPLKALKRKTKEIFFFFSSIILAWFSALLLKIFFHIPRPFIQFQNVVPLFRETDFSFPSGHATFFMALATAVFLYHKKIGYLFIFFALLIGVARIMAGVHFPFDILSGFLLGFIISYLLVKLFKKE